MIFGRQRRRKGLQAPAWLAVLAVAFHLVLGSVHGVALAASAQPGDGIHPFERALQALCSGWGQASIDEDGTPIPRDPCAACAQAATFTIVLDTPALPLPFFIAWDMPAYPRAHIRPAAREPAAPRPFTRAPPLSAA